MCYINKVLIIAMKLCVVMGLLKIKKKIKKTLSIVSFLRTNENKYSYKTNLLNQLKVFLLV